MSREIKFRGKSKETGHWVYGSLVQVSTAGSLAIATLDDKGHLKLQEIIKGTEGQYIGRSDDKGKDIFEGQQVKFTNLSLGRFSEHELWAEGVIAYDPEGSGYFISQEKGDGWNLRHSRVVALDDEGEAAKV